MHQFTNRFVGILLVVALAMLLVLPVQAEEEVSGSISQNTTWTADNETYLVTGDITVEAGVTLTIEPGVVVMFDGPYKFDVDGRLLASGSHDEPANDEEKLLPWDNINWIQFTQDIDGLEDAERWYGIRFNESDSGSRLEWVIVENGYARGPWPDSNGGAVLVRATSVTMQHSIFRNCMADNFGGALYMWSTASTFQNNLIDGCYAGDSGGGIYIDQATTVTFRNLTMVNNEAGRSISAVDLGNAIFFGVNTEPVIRASIFENNPEEDSDPFYSINPVDFRYGINSTLDDFDLTNFIYGQNSSFFSNSEYYTASDSSRAVDGGPSDDIRWENEPEPNGGPLGNRINLGLWGGTPFTARSVPVQSVPAVEDSTVNGSTTAMGDTTTALLLIKNIGAGLMTVRFDSLEFVQDRPTPEWEEAVDDWLIAPFNEFWLRPDSVNSIEVLYIPNDTVDDIMQGDNVVDQVYLTLSTDGGSRRYKLKSFVIDPHLVINTTSLYFDSVNFGAPETLYVELHNSGTTPMSRPSFTFPNASFSFGERPDLIEPLETVEIAIIANPLFKGPFGGSVTIQTNGGSDTFSVEAFAIGPNPYIETRVGDPSEADRNVIDFAFVNVDSLQTRTIKVKNDGNRAMRIGFESTDPNFFLNEESDGMIIPRDETKYVTVVFAPTGNERVYLDTLRLITTDTLAVTLTREDFLFQLTARSTAEGRYLSGDIPNLANNVPPVWGAEGDYKYVIAGASRIPPGESITILQGVEVLYENVDEGITDSTVPAYLEVEGILEALGTEEDPIVFKPLNGQLNGGGDEVIPHRHGGLRFLACDNRTRLEHVIIDSARTLSLEEIAEIDESFEDELVPNHLAHGGAVSIYNCSPTFEDVIIRNSISYQDGGGIWIYQAAPTIVRCLIEDNEAEGSENDGISEGNGGGVVLWGSEPNFFANTIRRNHATVDGGAFYFTSLSAGKIANNLCSDNTVDGVGGGLAMFGDSNPLLLNNVFFDNSAVSGTDGLYFAELSMPVMRNSVVWATVMDSPLIDVSNANPAITDSYIMGDYEDGLDIYTNEPEWDTDFMPTDVTSNLVDMGNESSVYQDYSFPPSLGEVRGDIGISGGPYAGHWGAPLRISVFRNPSSARSLSILVNSVDDLESTPSLTIEQFSGDEEIDELPAISEDNHAWGMGYVVSESATIQFITSAMWDDGEAVIETSVRREIIVSIYSQVGGASLSSMDGSSFTLPSYAVNKQMLLLANNDLSTELPPNDRFLISAGARFIVDAPVDVFNRSATIELPYDPAVVRVGRERGVSLWLLDTEGEWMQLESFVDTAARMVQAETRKPGTFVVLYETTGLSSELLPESTQLMANYPNPFNPTTTIPFTMKSAGEVRLTVFNVLGQKVTTIADGHFGPGTHMVMWNGHDDAGQPVASGVYFYRMETNPGSGSGLVQARKLVLMR